MPPINQLFHTDKVLTEVSIDTGNNEFIGDILCPRFSSKEKTSYIYSIDPTQEKRRVEADTMAPGTQANLVDFGIEHPKLFNCQKRGLRGYVPYEHQEVEGAIAAVTRKTEFIAHKLKTIREKRIKDAVDTALVAASRTTTPGTKWNASGGTPFADMKAKITTIKNDAAVSPSGLHLFMDSDVILGLSESADYKARVSSYELSSVNAVAANVAMLLGLQPGNIHVAGVSVINTAAKGAAPSNSSLWSDDVYLAYVENPTIQTRNFAMLPEWNSGNMAGNAQGGVVDGWRVLTWDDPEREANGVTVRCFYDIVILDAKKAWRFHDVLT